MTDAVEDALKLGEQRLADVAKGVNLASLLPPPYGTILQVAAYLAPLAALAGVILWIWSAGAHHQVAKDKSAIVGAQDAADVAGLETKGAQASAARVDAFQHLDISARDATARAAAQAGAAPDANAPLPPDRAARLAAADAELCRLQPDLCAAPAPAEPRAADPDAAGGQGPMRALPPAARTDPG